MRKESLLSCLITLAGGIGQIAAGQEANSDDDDDQLSEPIS